MGNNPTFPTATVTGKQPKPKKQKATQPKDGMETTLATPILIKKTNKCLICDCFLRKQTGKLDLRRINVGLRDFIEQLQKNGELTKITKPVSTEYEIGRHNRCSRRKTSLFLRTLKNQATLLSQDLFPPKT